MGALRRPRCQLLVKARLTPAEEAPSWNAGRSAVDADDEEFGRFRRRARSVTAPRVWAAGRLLVGPIASSTGFSAAAWPAFIAHDRPKREVAKVLLPSKAGTKLPPATGADDRTGPSERATATIAANERPQPHCHGMPDGRNAGRRVAAASGWPSPRPRVIHSALRTATPARQGDHSLRSAARQPDDRAVPQPTTPAIRR